MAEAKAERFPKAASFLTRSAELALRRRVAQSGSQSFSGPFRAMLRHALRARVPRGLVRHVSQVLAEPMAWNQVGSAWQCDRSEFKCLEEASSPLRDIYLYIL